MRFEARRNGRFLLLLTVVAANCGREPRKDNAPEKPPVRMGKATPSFVVGSISKKRDSHAARRNAAET